MALTGGRLPRLVEARVHRDVLIPSALSVAPGHAPQVSGRSSRAVRSAAAGAVVE